MAQPGFQPRHQGFRFSHSSLRSIDAGGKRWLILLGVRPPVCDSGDVTACWGPRQTASGEQGHGSGRAGRGWILPAALSIFQLGLPRPRGVKGRFCNGSDAQVGT